MDENIFKAMEKIKCITFDKDAQDKIPKHIREKMNKDREDAQKKRENENT